MKPHTIKLVASLAIAVVITIVEIVREKPLGAGAGVIQIWDNAEALLSGDKLPQQSYPIPVTLNCVGCGGKPVKLIHGNTCRGLVFRTLGTNTATCSACGATLQTAVCPNCGQVYSLKITAQSDTFIQAFKSLDDSISDVRERLQSMKDINAKFWKDGGGYDQPGVAQGFAIEIDRVEKYYALLLKRKSMMIEKWSATE